MPQEKIASQAYLEVAAAHGIDYVFGLPGTSGQEFIGTIADQEKIRFVLAMHETCVVAMADGHARVTGRPQLAQVSTLPGSANAIGALYDAYRDRSPVIVTSTNVDTRIGGRDSHTEGKDLVEMTKQFTKWSAEVHRADRIPEYLNRAFKVASTPPTGPVYLALPSNLLGETITIANPEADRSRIVPRIAGDPEALAEAAKLLVQAQRPVIVAGSRRIFQIIDRPAPGGSAGIGLDVTEAEAMRAELARMTEAHRRTLDQLATGVAIFTAASAGAVSNENGVRCDTHPVNDGCADFNRSGRV